MQNPSDASVRFNAEGHLCGTQWWTVDYPGHSVRLIVAFRAADNVKVIGVDIPASLNCQTFFKHCLIPSKSGRTPQQKALARAKHRKVATTMYANDASAHKIFAAARTKPGAVHWSRETPSWKASFADDKKGPAASPDAWAEFKEAARFDMDQLAGTVLSWHDKYGAPPDPVVRNSVLVLNDVRVRDSGVVRSWPNANGLAPLVPVTPLFVAEKLATTLEAYTGWVKMKYSSGWVETADEIEIDLEHECVLVVTAGNEDRDGSKSFPPLRQMGVVEGPIAAPTYRSCSSIKIRAARPTRAANVHDYVITHIASKDPTRKLL